jgi:hypothetical protein
MLAQRTRGDRWVVEMIGRTRSRRLGVLLAAGVLVFVAVGCTVGTTSIPADAGLGLVECSDSDVYWQPGPGATEIRFSVLGSDATQPLFVIVGTGDWIANVGTVWDGTQPTRQVRYDGAWNGAIGLFYEGFVPSGQVSTTRWAFSAHDANGKDVGFTCTGGNPVGAKLLG